MGPDIFRACRDCYTNLLRRQWENNPGCRHALFLLGRTFLGCVGIAVIGLDGGAYHLEHALGRLGELPIGLKFEVLVQCLLHARGSRHLAVRAGGEFSRQRSRVLELGIGIIGIGFDGFLEKVLGCRRLAGVDQHCTQIVVIFAGLGRIELGRLGQFGLGFVDLFGLGERQSVIVVIRSFVLFERDRLLVGFQSLIDGGLLVGARLGPGDGQVRIGEIGPNHMLVGIQLGALLEGVDGRVIVFRGQRFLAGVKGVVQSLVLRHGGGVFFGALLERVLLLLTHPTLLLFRYRARVGLVGRSLLRGSLSQVEVDRNGIAQFGLNVLHLILLLVVDQDADGVAADRKSIVDVMAFLVGLGAFVGALHVLALDKDLRILDHLAVGSFDVAFNSGDLRPRGARRKQERQSDQSVPA